MADEQVLQDPDYITVPYLQEFIYHQQYHKAQASTIALCGVVLRGLGLGVCA